MEPQSSHETHRKPKTDAKAPPVQTTTPLQWAGTLLVLLSFAAAVHWTHRQWSERATGAAQLTREVQWSIETPAARHEQVFVRIQNTSHWSPRAYGFLTSSSHLSTQSAPAELKSAHSGAKIILAPRSLVQLDGRDLTVLRGFAQVTGPVRVRLTKSDRFITAQETLLVAASGNTEESALFPSLEPGVGSIHDLQVSGRVTLSWPKSLASTSAVLEFARDSSFETILFTHPASGTPSTSVDFSDRSPGAWFVRLREGSRNVAFTAFNLVESQTPDQLRRLGRRWLAWRDRGLAAIYRVEFSENETFQKVHHSILVRNHEVDLIQVKPGSYFARVTALAPALTSGHAEHVSRPVAIQVQEKSEILRAGLELNDPNLRLHARGWKILLTHDESSRIREGYVILRESELRGVKVSNEVLQAFQENGTLQNRNLVFEISRDEMFSNPERVRPDSRGELLPPALPLGILYTRLRRIENDGTLGAYGPASRLTTWLPAPIARVAKMQSTENVELRWDLNTAVAGYELRVSPSRQFEPIDTQVMRTRGNGKKVELKGMRGFFWTVTAVNDLGLPVSLTSPVQEFKMPEEKKSKTPLAKAKTVERVPAMRGPLVPILESPAEDAVVVGGARATKYGKLTWNFDSQSPTPRTYIVEIATDGDFVNIVEKGKTKTPQFTLQGDLPEGALFWRVRLAKPSGQGSAQPQDWSRSRRFELVYE